MEEEEYPTLVSCAEILDPRTSFAFDKLDWVFSIDHGPLTKCLTLKNESYNYDEDLDLDLDLDLFEDIDDLELVVDVPVLDTVQENTRDPLSRWEEELFLEKSTLYSLKAWTLHEKKFKFIFLEETVQDCKENKVTKQRKPSKKNKPKKKETSKKSESASTTFACDVCPKKFAKPTSLQGHLTTHAREKTIYNCPHCDIVYTGKSQLTRHFKRCHSDRMYVCHLCSQFFVDSDEFNEHAVTKACQIFECKSCDETFARLAALKEHQYNHVDGAVKQQREVTVAALKKEQVDGDLKQPLVVSKQHQRLKDEAALKQEQVVEVEVDLNQKRRVRAGKKLICAMCGSDFENRVKLVRHMRLKHAPERFSCQVCGKRFVRPDHYQIHMRRHNNLRPCVCVTCGKSFCQKSDLNRHRKYVHLGAVRRTVSKVILELNEGGGRKGC